MNTRKLMKFAAMNTIGLLIFASLLASCQKEKCPKSGHFTKMKNASRTIASISSPNTQKLSFIEFQDPKQIVMFCDLNSKKPETCYSIHFENALLKFTNQNKSNVKPEQVASLKDEMTYENVKNELNGNLEQALSSHQEFVSSLVNKRKSFCYNNSKKDLERCLNQYLKRDTFTVLNQYQNTNNLNGVEYLFLKKKITSELEKNFQLALKDIRSSRGF